MQTRAPRRLAPEDRRNALLDAAVRVLQHRVMAELSFEAVAEEAGVSKTLPYRYFESPADIAVALFDRVVGKIDEAIDGILESSLDFDDKVRATLNLWFDSVETDGRLAQRVLEAKAVPVLQPLLEQRDRRAVEIWTSELAREFSMKRSDAQFVAFFLTAAATSVVDYWIEVRSSRKVVVERYVRAARATGEAFTRVGPPGLTTRA